MTTSNMLQNKDGTIMFCTKKIGELTSLFLCPATGRGGPRGSGWVEAPDFLDVPHYKGGRSSEKRTGRLYPRRNP